MTRRISTLCAVALGLLGCVACAGKVVSLGETGGAGTGSTSSLESPWHVPGPCAYQCGDAGACASPCLPGETPDPSTPYVCCADGECIVRQVVPQGISASCPACPSGWTPRPDDPSFCCNPNGGCYSQATGILDPNRGLNGGACFGSTSACGCSVNSVDGHKYALSCNSGGCVCTKDGQRVKSLPSLCSTANQSGAFDPPNDGYLLWACGFPPM